MKRVKIQIGPAKHKYIYRPVEKGMWSAESGGGDVNGVWVCERADDKHASQRKLILVEFADKVIAYDCCWGTTDDMEVVFWDPREKYCRTAALGDVSAVFKNGLHEWLIKHRDGWRSGGRCSTEVSEETDGEPMLWMRDARVRLLWHVGDEPPAGWLMVEDGRVADGGKRKRGSGNSEVTETR